MKESWRNAKLENLSHPIQIITMAEKMSPLILRGPIILLFNMLCLFGVDFKDHINASY